jgi:hypothetical protein
MKTVAYSLQEEQIDWLKTKAEQNGQSTISAALRRVLREAMERDGVVLSLMKPAEEPAKLTNQN